MQRVDVLLPREPDPRLDGGRVPAVEDPDHRQLEEGSRPEALDPVASDAREDHVVDPLGSPERLEGDRLEAHGREYAPLAVHQLRLDTHCCQLPEHLPGVASRIGLRHLAVGLPSVRICKNLVRSGAALA